MDQKVVLITGSTDGIGRATALELAARGYRLILHGRDPARIADLLETIGANGHQTLIADLADLRAVDAMAREVRSSVPRLHVLLNNAGVYLNERLESRDGYELTFAVNHLAHFLLTRELLPLLRSSAPARIINVSSAAHEGARIDFDDLQAERSYGGYAAYAQSKLANVLFTRSLASRLAGSDVTANALHPGVIDTKLLREGFSMRGSSVEQGADTPVYLATSSEVAGISGGYFVNRRPASVSPTGRNDSTAERLWLVSETLVNGALSGSPG